MPDPTRLDTLRTLREDARISQEIAATYCGLSGRQGRLSLGAWENGESIPQRKRRARFIPYLWDHLGLRSDPQKFLRTWDILVEEWEWEPISDREWQGLTSAPRPVLPPAQLAPTSPAPFQAPALTPHFVGRDAEFAQIETVLTAATGPRIVALVGMGGIGKTTLAVGLAHRLRAKFKDGVLWGHAATSDPLDILQSWALAFGCDFSSQASLESRAAAMRMLLDNKQVLLIIDDVREPESVRPLLPNSQRSIVLITTRDHDIALALSATTTQLNVLSPEKSLELLIKYAGAPRINAELNEVNIICETLQHHPLALEIVSKLMIRTPNQPLAVLASRLRNETKRLDQLQFKDLSVRASFEVSWELLNKAGKRNFSLLALFGGRSFDCAAFAALAELDTQASEDVLLLLISLSLLNTAASGRYQQHSLLADFAGEHLADKALAYHRLATHYVSFCRQYEGKPTVIEAGFDNVMASMRAMFDYRTWEIVLEFAEVLERFWFDQGKYTEARRGLAWSTQAAEELANREKRAWALRRWGEACLEQDDYEEASALLQRALLHAEDLEEDLLVADVHLLLGRMLVERSDLQKATSHLILSRQLYTNEKNRRGQAATIYFQALADYFDGKLDEAFTKCLEAQSLQTEEEDHRGLITTLRLLANASIDKHELSQASVYCQRAFDLANAEQNQSEVASCFYLSSVIARLQGEIEQSQHFAERALLQFERMGDLGFTAASLYELGQSYKARRQFAQAKQMAKRSLEMLRQSESYANTVPVLHLLGEINWSDGKNQDAVLLWREAIELGTRYSHPWTIEVQKSLETAVILYSHTNHD